MWHSLVGRELTYLLEKLISENIMRLVAHYSKQTESYKKLLKFWFFKTTQIVCHQNINSFKCQSLRKELKWAYLFLRKAVNMRYLLLQSATFFRPDLVIRVRPRFFDQVGHEIMYASNGNNIFSLNPVIVRPTKIRNRADKNWAQF